ncbi:response regulator [Candidatus Gottesmanbacteria bacterium]|nr:response regulator [Candidatus Gottesmanbacteria bacterium]
MTKHILIIDDDLEILEVIKIVLEEKGYEVTTLSDGNSLTQKLQLNIPDLILLDIWMSGIDGPEIAKSLKSDEKTKKIPIIMISANNEGARLAKEVQAEEFLAKPFDIDDLLNIVNKYLS